MNTSKRGYTITDEETQLLFSKTLTKTSLLHTFYSITLCYFLIILSAFSCCYVFDRFGVNAFSLGFYILAIFVIAARQRGLENLIHDAQHLNLSRNPIINDAIAWCMLALPLGRNLSTERYNHIQLHHNNFWTDKDPDLKRYRNMGLDALPADSYMSLLKLLLRAFPTYMLDVVPEFFAPKNETKTFLILRYSYWCGVISAFNYFDHAHHLVLYWHVPFFSSLSLIRFVAEVSEHAALECKNEFVSTRNNLGWFNEWFIQPCGTGYHMVHHIFPKIPWFNLARAHELLIKDKTYANGNNYGSFFFGKDSTIASLVRQKTSKKEQTIF